MQSAKPPFWRSCVGKEVCVGVCGCFGLYRCWHFRRVLRPSCSLPLPRGAPASARHSAVIGGRCQQTPGQTKPVVAVGGGQLGRCGSRARRLRPAVDVRVPRGAVWAGIDGAQFAVVEQNDVHPVDSHRPVDAVSDAVCGRSRQAQGRVRSGNQVVASRRGTRRQAASCCRGACSAWTVKVKGCTFKLKNWSVCVWRQQRAMH